MAEKNISGKIIQAVYTTDELSQEPLCNKVIDDGLVVYEKCEDGKIKSKMGDGEHTWSELEYIEKESEINDEIISSETTYSSNKVEDLSNNNLIFSDNDYKNIISTLDVGEMPMIYSGSSHVIYDNELHVLGSGEYRYYENIYYTYNSTTGEYSEFKNLPCNIEDGLAIEYNNELHVLGNDVNGEYDENVHYKFNGEEWSLVSTLDYNFDGSNIVIYNNEIHILGGYESTSHFKYDTTSSSWIEVSTLPYVFNNGRVIVYNDELYIMGGGSADTQCSFYKFNNTTLEWTSVGELPFELYASGAIVYDNSIHLIGGTSTDLIHYKYNGVEWVALNQLPDEYNSTCSCYINNNGKLEIKTYYGDIYIYDSENDQWIENGALPFDTYDPVLMYNNEIYVTMGGETGLSPFEKSHYKWNGIQWTKVSELPYEFVGGSAVVYNNEIHILGSAYEGNETLHYKFNKDTSTWTEVSTIPYEFCEGHAIEFDNSIHILGGDEYDELHCIWNGENWSEPTELPFECYNSSYDYRSQVFILNDCINVITHSGRCWAYLYEDEWNYNDSAWCTDNLLAVIIKDNYLNLFSTYNNEDYTFSPMHTRYDLTQDTWETVRNFGKFRRYQHSFNFISYDDEVYMMNNLNFSKYLPHYKISLYADKGRKLYIKNAFAISNNIEETNYGFIITENGNVEIGIIQTDESDINAVFNDIYEWLNHAFDDQDVIDVSNGGTGYNSYKDYYYSDVRYRGTSLHSSEKTPTTNGVIAWMYE